MSGDYPWRDKDKLQEAIDAAGSSRKAGDILGCHNTTVVLWANKLGIPLDACNQHKSRQYGKITLPENPEPSDAEILQYLEDKGYNLTKNPEPTGKLFDLKKFKGDRFRVGVVSDTHLCSKFQQLTHLHAAYQHFEQEGITEVLHAGDVTAGNGRVYRGQEYELFVLGADEQAAYAVENYPSVDGITTHVIAGNHDLSFMKTDGLDIMKMIAKDRPDMNYLGHYSATVQMDSIKVMLHHGEGGGSYARSYKLQKLIEQLSPENKPNIFIGGHYHSNCWLPMYRNVSSMLVGCFEAQTPYLTRKGLYPEIGFYVLEIVKDADGLVAVKPEWFPAYVPIANDY